MKNYLLKKHLLLVSLAVILLFRFEQASAQVDKAIKYAWFFDYENAEKYLSNSQNELNDSMVVELAEALYQQGKYPQALYYYKIADKKGAIRTQQEKRNYVYASTMMREKSPFFKKSNYFKTNYFLYTNLDTFPGNSANEDFTSLVWNDLLFVTTSRRTNNNDKNFQYVLTKMPYLDVYPFTEKGKRMAYPAYLPKNINTAMHDGPIAISMDTNLIVLTRNYSKANANGVQNLYLTYYLRSEKRKWGAAKRFEFCKSGFSAQHPFYNEDEKALYFSSDMPGGLGGFDIYKTTWNGTQWTPPVNLGSEINTEFDEVFPGFSPEGDLLYSTNHIETSGGLDIVMYSHGSRYLLNEPFNSIYDDFGVTFKSKKEGYFSSNRFSNKFDDNIYHFNLSEPEKQSLVAKVFDARNNAELDQAKITYYDSDNKYLGEIYTTLNADNVLIKDNADVRKPIRFVVTKNGYLPYDRTTNDFHTVLGKLSKNIYLEVSPILASDDYIQLEKRRNNKIQSILSNDTLFGKPVSEFEIRLQVVSNPVSNYVNIEPGSGAVKYNPGLSDGKYKITYIIQSIKSPTLVDTAFVFLTVGDMEESFMARNNRSKNDAEEGDDFMVRNRSKRGSKNEVVEPEESESNFMERRSERKRAKAAERVAKEKYELETQGIWVTNDTGYTTINGGYILNIRNNDKINDRKASSKNSVIKNERSDNSHFQINRKTGAITMSKGVEPGIYHLSYELYAKGNKEQNSEGLVTIFVRSKDQIPGKGAQAGNQMTTNNTVVYFHNDDPRPYQIFKPAFNYQNSFDFYMKHVDDFYQRSSDTKASLDTFFTSHVEGGMDDLNDALNLIQKRLNQGVQVEISVSAYCSPIASTRYNEKLSSRRIISVTRYLKKWNDGALWDAIESNRITFWEHAVGELESPRDVSSDYNKLDLSVFGIKASRERRVSVTVKIIGSN